MNAWKTEEKRNIDSTKMLPDKSDCYLKAQWLGIVAVMRTTHVERTT